MDNLSETEHVEIEMESKFVQLNLTDVANDPVHNLPPLDRITHFPNVGTYSALPQQRFGELLGPCSRARVNIATGYFDSSQHFTDYKKTGGLSCSQQFSNTEFTSQVFKTNANVEVKDIPHNVVATGSIHAISVKEGFFSKFLNRGWHFYSKKLYIAGSSFTKSEIFGLLAYGSTYKVVFVNCTLVGNEKMNVIELFHLIRFADHITIDIEGLEYPKNWLDAVTKIERVSRIKMLQMHKIQLNFEQTQLMEFLSQIVDQNATIELVPQQKVFENFKLKSVINHFTRLLAGKFMRVSAEDFNNLRGSQKLIVYSPKAPIRKLRFVDLAAAKSLGVLQKKRKSILKPKFN